MPQDWTFDRKMGRTALARAVLGAALAAAVVSANASAARAGDDDDNPTFMAKVMNTLGFKDPLAPDDSINYSERSPLVVPPTRDLPPPASASAPPVPNWPKDPDIARRQATRVKEKPAAHPDWVTENARALRPNELNVGHGTDANAPKASTDDDTVTHPKKGMFNFDWFKKEQYATFTGEPARTSLTDPPPGYQTPSPDQPYGVGPEKKGYKIQTLGDRVEPVR